MDEPIARCGGVQIAAEDVQLMLKLGPGRLVLDEILLRKIAAAAAEQRGISISAEQLDAALAELYAGLELFEPPQVAQWLEAMKVDESALRRYLSETLLKEQLRAVLVTDEMVRQRFASSPYDFATLHLQKIVVEGQGAAAELMLQLKEEEINWEQAAKQVGAMDSQILRRQDAPPEAAAALYAARLGEFVGPVEEAMDSYAIYRVAWKDEPDLNDTLREEIGVQLYQEQLRTMAAARPLEFLR
jgi:hypothetical protein